jgi:hypothetical protein
MAGVIRPRQAAVASLLVLVAAAGCSTAPSVAPSAAGSPPAASVPAASPAESVAPSPNLHGSPDLEARIPDVVANVRLSKVSLTGADFRSTGTATTQGQLDELLAGLNATAADLSVAQGSDPAGILVLQVGVFRVRGAEGNELLTLWVAGQQAALQNRLLVDETDVAGRHVTRLRDPERPVGTATVVFASGDTLYIVLAADEAVRDEALEGIRPA